MSLPKSDQDWLTHLATLHDVERPRLRSLNDEYELRSPKQYMHPEIWREIGDRLQQVVIAWPQLVVDSIEERLDVEGFRLPDASTGDDDLWRVWQENSLDEESQLGHVDALVMKRAYIAVGTNEDDGETPRMTFESPLEVYGDIDPRTRQVRAALRRYGQYQGSQVRAVEQYATLYLPDYTVYYEQDGSDWKVVERDDHGLGVVPLVPLVNRARLADWCGASELSPILPIAHAANKIATDMMVAAEFVALPLRGVFGIGPEDLEDQAGNKITGLQAMLGRVWTIQDDTGQAKTFEFTSANLTNFHDSINQLAKLVASLAALPAHYLGMTTDNPPSADAIRSNEIRLIKRAERKQRAFGGAYEQAMRIVRRFQEGDWDPSLRRLETVWRDASTPTVAQKADAAVKLYQAGLVPLAQSRRDLGYTDAQIAQMEQDDDTAAIQLKMPTAAELMALRDPQPTPNAAPADGTAATPAAA